ncbi:hypothetical protein Poly30_44100 [Planctomycetes bacterium Poly30]|uniref:PEGA domain-containing protein n=1 Tax=Saltatorellus ferox TaxID=2528018 RepID=A0A518EXN6_9BACT|nr:hypothetical protein Poly30_44100 [Planctomycetes bacterium Poly30]
MNEGRVEMVLEHLLPGHLQLVARLDGADPVRLVGGWHGVDVVAGVEATLSLPTLTGGMLQLSVASVLPPTERTLADVQFRRSGADAWEELSLITREESPGGWSIMQNSSALVGGPDARTPPMEPGHYDLRVTLQGHEDATSRFRILEGQTEALELTLRLKDD